MLARSHNHIINTPPSIHPYIHALFTADNSLPPTGLTPTFRGTRPLSQGSSSVVLLPVVRFKWKTVSPRPVEWRGAAVVTWSRRRLASLTEAPRSRPLPTNIRSANQAGRSGCAQAQGAAAPPSRMDDTCNNTSNQHNILKVQAVLSIVKKETSGETSKKTNSPFCFSVFFNSNL